MEQTLVKLKIYLLLIKYDELLQKYNWVCEKVKNSHKREFDSESVYNGKYLKAKTKSCNEKLNANFHNSKIPRGGSQFSCLYPLWSILINFYKNYYLQVFWEECKYVIK